MKLVSHSNFDAESHFNSKLRRGTIRDQGTIISFASKPFNSKIKTQEKGLKKIKKEKFRYNEFMPINIIHTEYIKELKGNLHPDAFMDVLYKAELTGAKVRINGKEGFVIEERKNSMCVIFEDDKVNIFPKNVWDFVYTFENIDYFFYSENLKKNRFLKG